MSVGETGSLERPPAGSKGLMPLAVPYLFGHPESVNPEEGAWSKRVLFSRAVANLARL